MAERIRRLARLPGEGGWSSYVCVHMCMCTHVMHVCRFSRSDVLAVHRHASLRQNVWYNHVSNDCDPSPPLLSPSVCCSVTLTIPSTNSHHHFPLHTTVFWCASVCLSARARARPRHVSCGREQSAQLRKEGNDLRQSHNDTLVAMGQQVRQLQAELRSRGESQMQAEESMRNLHLGFSPIVTTLESQLASLGKHQVSCLLSLCQKRPMCVCQKRPMCVCQRRSICKHQVLSFVSSACRGRLFVFFLILSNKQRVNIKRK